MFELHSPKSKPCAEVNSFEKFLNETIPIIIQMNYTLNFVSVQHKIFRLGPICIFLS